MEITINRLIKRVKSLKFHIVTIILLFMIYGVFKNYHLIGEKKEYTYNVRVKTQSEMIFNISTGFDILEMQVSKESNVNIFTLKSYYESLAQAINYDKCFQPNSAKLCFVNIPNLTSSTKIYYDAKIRTTKNFNKSELVNFINNEVNKKSKIILSDFYKQFNNINASLFSNELAKPDKFQIELSEKFIPFVYELDQSEKILINPKKMFIKKLIVFFVVSILFSAIYVISPIALRSLFK